jgi:hypothetical protein
MYSIVLHLLSDQSPALSFCFLGLLSDLQLASTHTHTKNNTNRYVRVHV